MTDILCYDDATARTFEPFALTRPAGELRAGALLVRDRWAALLGASVKGHLTSAHLVGFEEPGAAPVVAASSLAAGSWIVNARALPALGTVIPAATVLRIEGKVAAVRLGVVRDGHAFADGRASLDDVADGAHAADVAGWWADNVWDYVRHLVSMLEADLPRLAGDLTDAVPEGCYRVGSHAVWVEPGAHVEPHVCFDTTGGPVLIRTGAHVQGFSRLMGPLYIGEGSTVTADRIASSSIGDTCKVHGELSNSIFIGHANKGHDGFVGHSMIGRWVNLGAGTITSNLKNTYGTVQLWTPSGIRETDMQFLGTLFGDHAKTGIGLRLTTGTVLGAGANVFGSEMPPKAVAPFSWGEAGAFVDFRVDKFLAVAARMMARRHVTLGEGAARQLRASYDARWSAAE